MKCLVLEDTVLAVGKGSIVEVSLRQYELAKKKLAPVAEEKKEIKVEKAVAPAEVETATLPKARKTKKK